MSKKIVEVFHLSLVEEIIDNLISLCKTVKSNESKEWVSVDEVTKALCKELEKEENEIDMKLITTWVRIALENRTLYAISSILAYLNRHIYELSDHTARLLVKRYKEAKS